jgi:hypothetical protein
VKTIWVFGRKKPRVRFFIQLGLVFTGLALLSLGREWAYAPYLGGLFVLNGTFQLIVM